MPDASRGTNSAWWRSVQPTQASFHASETDLSRLRDEHWAFFEATVLPQMTRLVRQSFPSDVAETIRNRIAIRNRFRASEFLFALLTDMDCHESAAGIWACACVEFLVLSRLTQDDVVDRHDYRWGLPSLRMLYEPDKASLAATELLSLAIICAEEMDDSLEHKSRTRLYSVPVPVLIADYSHKMAQSMLRELLFDDVALSEDEYEEISTWKHCNGSLCTHLCRGMSDDLDEATFAALAKAAVATDMAAAIANDVAETDQRRGLDAVRFPQGEQRGDRTEFQLGRPTIFHVFLASDERVRNQSETEVTNDSINLSELTPAVLFETLTELGGIDYARARRDSWRTQAFTLMPPGFVRSAEWMGSTAKLNVRTQ